MKPTPPCETDILHWRFHLDGMVAHPLTLDYQAVRDLPHTEAIHATACIHSAVDEHHIQVHTYRGLSLADLLSTAGAAPHARYVIFEAADGYATQLPREKLAHALLADSHDGVPLSPEHGGPLRLVMPGLYGYKQPRWLRRATVVNFAYQGVWERLGWSGHGDLHPVAILTHPGGAGRVALGTHLELRGMAVGPVAGVEVQIDGGHWMAARLDPAPPPRAWVGWSLPWKFDAPGLSQIVVRAFDKAGNRPPAAPTPAPDPFPDGVWAAHHAVITVSGAQPWPRHP